ncbi:uncharacterized protein J3R85_009694 [Psidium guajava]|nr:uncharacterized protein J3R85_009694 [Psidium guajava]
MDEWLMSDADAHPWWPSALFEHAINPFVKRHLVRIRSRQTAIWVSIFLIHRGQKRNYCERSHDHSIVIVLDCHAVAWDEQLMSHASADLWLSSASFGQMCLFTSIAALIMETLKQKN